MGSEVILPGTPLNQIPAGDRPIFDPTLQNGYAGLAGGGASVNGQAPIGVTKEVVQLRAVLAAVGTPKNCFGVITVFNIAAGGNTNFDLSANLGVDQASIGTLTLQALGSVTTGAVFLGAGSASGINITKAPNGTLVLPNFPLYAANDPGADNGFQLFNTDAAAQNVAISFTPNSPSVIDATINSAVYDFGSGAGPQFKLGQTDILRIRELHLQLMPASAPAGQFNYFGDVADLRIETNAPIPVGFQNFAIVSHRLLKGARSMRKAWGGGDTVGSNVQLYSLEQPIIIAGSDAIIGGQVGAGQIWSPRVWAEYYFAGNAGVQPVLLGVFEIFRNANS